MRIFTYSADTTLSSRTEMCQYHRNAVMFQTGCCKESQLDVFNGTTSLTTSTSTVSMSRPQCQCPPCLSRAESHLNTAAKTVGTLGLVFSLTEVFISICFTYFF